MPSAEDVIAEILKRVRPDEKERERVSAVASLVYERVERVVRELGLPARVEYEGSFIKDTWLSGDVDLDLFVIFDRGFPEEEFEKAGLEVGRRCDCAAWPFVLSTIGLAISILVSYKFLEWWLK